MESKKQEEENQTLKIKQKSKKKLEDLKRQLNDAQNDLENNQVVLTRVTNDANKESLTARQSAFIDYFITTNNATAAAISAGYSKESANNQAAKTLAKPHVQVELQRRKQIFMLEHGITREYILQELLDVINDSKNCLEGRKNTDILKAIDILNKMSGNYTQTNVNVNIEMPPLFPDIN
jgi:phage terminase small subunit